MEYCGAGSVLDIMKLRGIHHNLPRNEVVPLTEEQIATVVSDTLKGGYISTSKWLLRTKQGAASLTT